MGQRETRVRRSSGGSHSNKAYEVIREFFVRVSRQGQKGVVALFVSNEVFGIFAVNWTLW
jgi:hypothetical protein